MDRLLKGRWKNFRSGPGVGHRLSRALLSLRIVNRTAVALLAGGVLHVLQLLLLIFELGFHDFHLLLFLLLALVPLHAVGYTIPRSEMD